MTNEREVMPNASPQPPPRPPQPLIESGPARAAVCALIPGIGAVYNREYTKAVVHFAIFASLGLIAESVGIFGLAAFSFYVFTIIDAYRSADRISRLGSARNEEQEGLNVPLWGGILVLIGTLFLLDNLGAVSIRSAIQFWPLALIFLGSYLLYIYFTGDKDKASRSGGRVPPVDPLAGD